MGKSNSDTDSQKETVRVPAGKFLYGTEKEERELPEFWIDKTPVTNAKYARFVAATGYEPPEHWEGKMPPEQIADHPVTRVSWHDARAYAEWAGKRLPTEEEWEKAARGTDGREYPWGDWEEGRCNSKEAGIGTVTAVGQYSPDGDSPYGCVDIAGNVWEWTASQDGRYQVLRGGSFNHGRDLARCTFRVRHKPTYRYWNIGFRVLVSMQPPQPIIVVDLFPEILDELLKLLSSLSVEDWQKPTVCPGWSVKDVALHLLGVEIGNLSRRRDDHAIDASIASWDELVMAINDWNQGWVQAAQYLSPRLLIDLLEFTGVQLCEFFQLLDLYALGGTVSWAGPEPAPVWLDLAREYTERWHHQQHIRDAVGKPGLKQPRYFAPVLATFVWALPRTFRSTVAAENTSVTLTITGESGGRWSLLREAGEWRLFAGAPDQPDAEVTIDQDIAWRLFTRGLDQSLAGEQMAVRGDRALGLKVLDMVSIIA